MAVQVTIKQNFLLLYQPECRSTQLAKPNKKTQKILVNEIPDTSNYRIEVLELGFIIPVQIPPSQGASVVADDDPIRVEHGNNLEYEHVPQQLVQGYKRYCMII